MWVVLDRGCDVPVCMPWNNVTACLCARWSVWMRVCQACKLLSSALSPAHVLLPAVPLAPGRLQVRITLLESQVHKLEARLGEANAKIADLQAENEDLKLAAVGTAVGTSTLGWGLGSVTALVQMVFATSPLCSLWPAAAYAAAPLMREPLRCTALTLWLGLCGADLLLSRPLCCTPGARRCGCT